MIDRWNIPQTKMMNMVSKKRMTNKTRRHSWQFEDAHTPSTALHPVELSGEPLEVLANRQEQELYP